MTATTPVFGDRGGGPVAVATADLPWHEIGRVGIKLRDMSFRDPKLNLNVRVAVGITGPQAFSPRHRHTFEQIRYYIDGPAKFGETVYTPGDCVYFPEGVAYGPQIGYNDQDCLHVTLQFNGPSGIYYPTPEEQVRAQNELAATGTFIGGKYRSPDGREQDAMEATIEHLTGVPVKYPEPRYDRPIRMRVPAYRALPLDGDDRVRVRHLAAFNEAGPTIRFVDAAAGSTLPGGRESVAEVRLLISGSVRYGGRDYSGQSCFFFPSQTPYPALEIASDAQLLHVRFGGAS
jgi:hypothetical protein